MKDWIQEKYPDNHQLSYDALREVVQAAWDAVPEDFLRDLVESMQARCQAVINAEGGHTKYHLLFILYIYILLYILL
jgi:hypothetical protein